jgi:serine/threonine protein kinase
MVSRSAATELSDWTESKPKIPGFEVIRSIGRGGMGQVYLARQTDGLNREVAIKTILDQRDGDYFRRKFLEEGQRQAELHHPHILPIFVAGETDDLLFLAMHFARNGNLRDRLSSGKLPVEESVSIVSDVLEALHHAHNDLDAPLAHLDVKPENILFDGSNVCLADFGIARKVDQTTGPATMVAGDPRYWAPEQQVNNASTQSDIFALGTTFFELLTGKRPSQELRAISSRSGAKSLRKQLPASARKYGPLITRCLQEDPRLRPTASEMLEELRHLSSNPKPIIRPFVAAALLLGLGYVAIQPGIQASALQQWNSFFPHEQYSVNFAISPIKSELWINGKEETFRELNLTQGKHNIVTVADGYIGESQTLEVARTGQTVSIELASLPPISDEDYLNFSKSFGVDGETPVDTGNEPTLTNVAELDEFERDNSAKFEDRIQTLKSLANAGDSVAATTLFYAAFEGIGVPKGAESYVSGLIQASDSGYALASLLRALYILQNLLEAGQTFDKNPQAYAQIEEFLLRAAAQGMPETANLAAATAGINLNLNPSQKE